jgi:aminopeptidase N
VDGAQQLKDFNVTLSKDEQDFYFALPAAPDFVRIDPELTILAKWDFKPSRPLLEKQLKADFLSRSLAVEALGSENADAETVKLLGAVLAEDAHHGVRSDAAKALQVIGSEDARKALISQINQPDERVRRSVVDALGALYHRESRDALAKLTETEQNPAILGRLLSSLVTWPDFDAAPFLKRDSYHGMILASAIESLENQNRQDGLPAILEAVKASLTKVPANRLAGILENVAALGKGVKNSPAQPFLAGFLTNPNANIRVAAAKALGEQGDVISIPMLSSLAKVKLDQAAPAALEAIARIKAQQTTPEQTQEAWRKVETLQKKSDELEKKLEKLESRIKTGA